MNDSQPRHIFLYGTLLPEVSTPEAPAVGDRLVAVGEARVRGRLIDLGRYPGLVMGEGDDAGGAYEAWVRGRVYAVADASVLTELDVYEDAHPEEPDRGLFVREKATARLDAGGEVVCWVYRYNADAEPGRIIPGGSWRDHRGT